MIGKPFSEMGSPPAEYTPGSIDPDMRLEQKQSVQDLDITFQAGEGFDNGIGFETKSGDARDCRLHAESNDLLDETRPPKSDVEKQDEAIADVESGKTPLDTSHQKGNYGEMKTDQDLRKRGYERISTDMVTDINAPTHQGIDGVYYNPDGKPPYIIVDSKYGSSQLSETADGKQMSQSWIDPRLEASVGAEMADTIFDAMLDGDVGCYVAHIDSEGNVTYDQLDSDGNVIQEGVDL